MADQTSVPKLTDLTRGEHVRLISASIIRILIGFAVIWLALSFVPETPGIDLAGPIVVIVSCIVIYSWYFRRQLKKIKRSKFPSWLLWRR